MTVELLYEVGPNNAPWGQEAILISLFFRSTLDVLARGHRVSVSLLFSMQHKHYSYTKASERLRQH